MSRIGRQLVSLPNGVAVSLDAGRVEVKGPKGTLEIALPAGLTVQVAGTELTVTRPDDRGDTRALHGLTRALIANMVTGVTKGFFKELEIQGVGYRVEMKGTKLNLLLGFSHPVLVDVPEGLSVALDGNTKLRIEGIDKAQVGQFAANIRSLRPPEPYKGKGIRYAGEYVRRKVGKAAAGAGA